MAKFSLYDCDVGFKIDGVRYDFDHVDSVQIENPEMTRLTRGANAGNKRGLVYKEGVKEPRKITTMIMGMSPELKARMDLAHDNQERIDFFCIARSDGSSKMGKECILCQKPEQLTLDESVESLNVQVIMETYDLVENHKS